MLYSLTWKVIMCSFRTLNLFYLRYFMYYSFICLPSHNAISTHSKSYFPAIIYSLSCCMTNLLSSHIHMVRYYLLSIQCSLSLVYIACIIFLLFYCSCIVVLWPSFPIQHMHFKLFSSPILVICLSSIQDVVGSTPCYESPAPGSVPDQGSQYPDNPPFQVG